MNIDILQLSEGAKNARGITLIIDVFRAFTVECTAFHCGAKRIYPIADVEQAYAIKEKNPDYVLVGERFGKKMKGFDYGNSPFEIQKADVRGKNIIHTTSAGTQGIIAAKNADEILVGALCNASAVYRYIKAKNPQYVSLVCMGFADKHPTDEDTFCAEYIKSLLMGKPFDKENVIQILKNGAGARFFDPKNAAFSPPEDFYLSTEFDKYDFVLPVKYDENGLNYVEPMYVI